MALLFFFLVPLINISGGLVTSYIVHNVSHPTLGHLIFAMFVIFASYFGVSIYLGFRSYPMLYNFYLINGWREIGRIPGSYSADRALVEYETSFRHELEEKEKEREEVIGLEKLAQELLQEDS